MGIFLVYLSMSCQPPPFILTSTSAITLPITSNFWSKFNLTAVKPEKLMLGLINCSSVSLVEPILMGAVKKSPWSAIIKGEVT